MNAKGNDNYFIVDRRLPGLNEYISAMNKNRYQGNALKQETEQTIIYNIKYSQRLGHCKPVEKYPICVDFIWLETNKRRDVDNIASAKKFILDAMQKAGIIKGDGQKYVCAVSDKFSIPSDHDGVIVYISEGEEAT